MPEKRRKGSQDENAIPAAGPARSFFRGPALEFFGDVSGDGRGFPEIGRCFEKALGETRRTRGGR